MTLKLIKHMNISGTLICRTGLHIGGSKEDVEIGGMDNPVIRHPLTREPYIPGSSIKGKMRSLLEYRDGKISENGEPHSCKVPRCLICTVFGPHKVPDHDFGPSRLIVRDALLTRESKESLGRLVEEGFQYAEIKTENWIDRRTGVAGRGGLRSQERVPAGAEFDFRMSVRVFHSDDEKQLLDFIQTGLKLLQDDYLGGSGTRGYGEIVLENLSFE